MDLIDNILNFVESVRDKINALTTAINSKQAALVSGTNIKTVNSQSLLGAGDLVISGGSSEPDGTEFFLLPTGIGSAVSALGLSYSVVGTLTAPSYSLTNKYRSLKRVDYLVTTPATNAVASVRNTSTMFFRKGAVGCGFRFKATFGISTGASNASKRIFAGMRSLTSAATDVDPSTITNMIGFGKDLSDANLQLMHNASGTVTKIDLGSNFYVSTSDKTGFFTIEIKSIDSSGFEYYVKNEENGFTASGSVTTNIPADSQYLTPHICASVSGISSVIGLSIFNIKGKIFFE